ncbi:flagellar assembly protein FliH [Photobacterium sp. GB-56]|uniref:flagellar assembly protein FliH n=1 Tax=Photobacterium sp. GB-56 TaxID=2022106 RepID=UPI000D183AAE|nr:flagellar assembly protein FliH [Photobacterium sp. GB-56]PSV26242.1 flagellar assembly protein FliH [Photobacterium sp. GB-56]
MMKKVKIHQLSPGQYRPHRFPPVAEPVNHGFNDGLGDVDPAINWQDSQFELQQKLDEGFQQGLNKGYDEGFNQGVVQGRDQGVIEGQKDGFQQGYGQGEQAGREIFSQAVKPVEKILFELEQWQQEKDKQQRQLICDLVQKVSQQVIRAELTLMPQQILALVEEALDAIPGKTEKIIIELNPQDIDRIHTINKSLPESWKLIANPTLPVGGCQLITDNAEADVGCDARLEACIENVQQHLVEQNHPLDTPIRVEQGDQHESSSSG